MREQELSTPAACVAARAAAARRGGTRSMPARDQEGGGKAWEGTWHGLERLWGGGCTAHGRQERRRCVGQRNRGEGGEVDEGGLSCNFPKVQGLHCNV
jgi:hypothetical protein